MKLFTIFIIKIKKCNFLPLFKISKKKTVQFCNTVIIYFCKYYFIRPWCSILSTIKFWILFTCLRKIPRWLIRIRLLRSQKNCSWNRLKWDYILIQVLKRQKIVKHIIRHSQALSHKVPVGALRVMESAPNQISDIDRLLSCPANYCILNSLSFCPSYRECFREYACRLLERENSHLQWPSMIY